MKIRPLSGLQFIVLLESILEYKMFDWFKGNKNKEPSNVVPFPKPEAVPYVEPPKQKEKPATVFYRIGVTDSNRIAFNMGYSEITMTKAGVQNMIDQLEFFKSQLQDEE